MLFSFKTTDHFYFFLHRFGKLAGVKLVTNDDSPSHCILDFKNTGEFKRNHKENPKYVPRRYKLKMCDTAQEKKPNKNETINAISRNPFIFSWHRET